MSALISNLANRSALAKLAGSPAAILFISANVANVANLAFNMIFARLMGPELFSDVALLLTLKLAALSLFSASQFGLSALVAAGKMSDTEEADLIAGVSKLSFKLCIPLCLILLASAQWIASVFAVSDAWSIALIILTLPALVPISLYRGGAYGRVDLPRIVYSTQFEWMLRLFGGLALWCAGLGLSGVTAALVASVYIGALCASRRDQRQAFKRQQPAPQNAALLILKTSAPFAALQAAQILMLDGDLFIAKSVLSATDAGYLAALGLVQRIFFFAFLSFSALLLPLVAKKSAQDDSAGARRDLMNMLCALCTIGALPLIVMTLFAPLICSILFGAAYASMASLAPFAAASALCFAMAHLVTMYFVAKDNLRSAYIFAFTGLLVLMVLSAVAVRHADLGALVFTKFILMIGVAVFSLLMVKTERS